MAGMFEGKSVIVTGGASGIGRAAARRFGEEGARVCVADLDGARAGEVAAALAETGVEAFGIAVDIASEADNARMVAEATARFGGLDVAFLNAGLLGEMKPFFEHSVEDFDRLVGVNLRGTFLGIKAAGSAIRPDGAIVVTASTAGLLGLGSAPGYTASKHGVLGLVRAAAEALAERKVRINAICPGGVATPMILGDAAHDLAATPDTLPMADFRGLGSAEHIAELALFLASRRAAYITGGTHVADGGLTCCFAPQ